MGSVEEIPVLMENMDVDKDLVFIKVRKTATKSVIVDMEKRYFQTNWLQVINDTDHKICVDAGKLTPLFEKIDSVMKNRCLDMGLSVQEIEDMYSPIMKYEHMLIFSVSSNTVMFYNGTEYDSAFQIKNNLKKGDYVRMIIRLKKLYLKDYDLKCITEVVQIEKA